MRDGFEALYRAQYEVVHRFVARRLEGSSVDDVVASTFELAYRKLREDHPHQLGWLIRTAANLLKTELRRQHREHVALREVSAVRAAEDGPDRDLDILAHLVERMPRAQRDVLQLTYWDGLSAAEAAVVLGCSEQAVWKRLSRAKAALRSAWPDDAPTTWEEAGTYA